MVQYKEVKKHSYPENVIRMMGWTGIEDFEQYNKFKVDILDSIVEIALKDKEQMIFRMIFKERMTLREISEKFGYKNNYEQIRIIRNRSIRKIGLHLMKMRKLRKELADDKGSV